MFFLLLFSCTFWNSEPNVILIVLDTIRSDHVSACGYNRPTTPFLEELIQQGASIQCKTVAPGSWTLPSHASFFTGKEPIAHRAHAITSGVKSLEGTSARTRKLNKKLPTLAQEMKKRDYQSIAISANPVVSKGLGLLRGFDHTIVAEKFGKMHGKKLLVEIEKGLEKLNNEKPIFMFVNIADAHQPWTRVPSDIPWAPETKPIYYDKGKEENPWRRFVEEKMTGEEQERFLKNVTDLYDYGIWNADDNLSKVLSLLREKGVYKDDTRIVIVSDHGEFLGEYGLLDHGHYVYDENTIVPLITKNIEVDLEPYINGAHVFDLIRDGKLPEKQLPSRTAAWPHVRRCARTSGKAFCNIWAASWEGNRKLIWKTGEYFSLITDDSSEELQQKSSQPPLSFVTYTQEVQKDAVDHKSSPLDAEVMQMLKAAGYME
jgi:hypothetical protein